MYWKYSLGKTAVEFTMPKGLTEEEFDGALEFMALVMRTARRACVIDREPEYFI